MYLRDNFHHLGLKRLITTCYRNQDAEIWSAHDAGKAIMPEYDGFREGDHPPGVDDIGITELDDDGDFRKEESIRILQRADIVVTNPPFSLFREYVAQLVAHEKDLVVLGDKNAITCKDFFRLSKTAGFALVPHQRERIRCSMFRRIEPGHC